MGKRRSGLLFIWIIGLCLLCALSSGCVRRDAQDPQMGAELHPRAVPQPAHPREAITGPVAASRSQAQSAPQAERQGEAAKPPESADRAEGSVSSGSAQTAAPTEPDQPAGNPKTAECVGSGGLAERMQPKAGTKSRDLAGCAEIVEPPVETQFRHSLKPRSAGSESMSAATGRKTAYLTFDDGPSGSTGKILDILKSAGVEATFFVIGSESSEAKGLYKRIAAEGHAIGNHTYSHDYRRVYRSAEAFRSDLRKLDELLLETIGYRPDILRFPGGSNNHLSRKAGGRGIMGTMAKAMLEDGYQYFDWNVSSTDAAAPVQDKSMIIESVLGASKGKTNIIVLMHDNTYKTTTVEALPVIIRRLRADGFQFKKLTKASFTYQFLTP